MTSGIIHLTPENIGNWLVFADGAFWITSRHSGGGLVIFAAEWCGHCQRLARTLQQLQMQNPAHQARIFVIDVDQNPRTLAQFRESGYQASGYPTILQFFSNGMIGPLRFTGNRDAASLTYLLQTTGQQ